MEVSLRRYLGCVIVSLFYLESWGCVCDASGIFLDVYPLIRKRRVPECIGRRIFQVRRLTVSSKIGNRIAPNYSVVRIWQHAVMASIWWLVDCVLACVEKMLSIGRGWCWTQLPGPASKLRQFNDDDLFPLGEHRYEDGVFPVPHRPEKLLEAYYGNWRELPPEEKRHPYDKMKLVLPTQAPK